MSGGAAIDSTSSVNSPARCAASRARPLTASAMMIPDIPIASEIPSPAAVHSSRSSSKPVSAALGAARNALAHNRVCD
ncbi:hypothetical protein A4G26_13325 [Mycobacterium kansasii]|nr:hypothetical protein A4G26_13325 [Mycobacterium kansasii]